MPIPGNDVHRQLIQAHSETQHELEMVRGEIAAAGAELEQLSSTRGDSLLQLAQHYLPELSAEAVARTLPDIRVWVRELLQRMQAHVERLDSDIRELDRQRQQGEAELAEVTAELDRAEDHQEQIARQVSEKLTSDPEFSTLSNQAGQAEAALQRSEANLAEIEQDSLRKLPGYENSALFMYLWKRKFGTPEYASRGITRSTDQWLARYIGYRDAHKGYEFLKTTPGHMRGLIAEDRQALGVVMDELERRRDAVAEELGLPAILEEIKGLTARRAEQVERLAVLDQQSQEVQAERTRIGDTRGQYYQEAIKQFHHLLDRAEHRELAERARSTPSVEDDRIVTRLEGLTDEMQQASVQVRQRQEVVANLTRHLQSIGMLINRYRSAGFDSSRAQFNVHLDVLSDLRAVRDGQGDYEEVWQRLRKSQRWGANMLEQATAVAAHPMTQILVHAMIEVAGAALQSQVRQAGERRGSSRPPMVLRPPRPPRSIGGGGNGGGFKNRGGF